MGRARHNSPRYALASHSDERWSSIISTDAISYRGWFSGSYGTVLCYNMLSRDKIEQFVVRLSLDTIKAIWHGNICAPSMLDARSYACGLRDGTYRHPFNRRGLRLNEHTGFSAWQGSAVVTGLVTGRWSHRWGLRHAPLARERVARCASAASPSSATLGSPPSQAKPDASVQQLHPHDGEHRPVSPERSGNGPEG